MAAQHWMIGDVRVTRVSYFDIGLPPETISLEAVDLQHLSERGVDITPWVPHQLTKQIALTHTGVHSEGHLVATISSNGHRAALIGHLAVSPLHLYEQVPARLHVEPENAPAVISQWLRFAATNEALLFGPLWPAPGAVRVASDTLIPAPAFI